MTDPEGLLEVLALKALPRAGWVRRGISEPESVAAHSWGVAWLVLVLCPDDLDLARALTYAVVHDLPEVRVGDRTPHDGEAYRTKAEAEAEAMAAMAPRLPRGPRIRAAWEAYEAQADPEARFVRQLDRLDMALQAVAYQEREGSDLSEFLASAARAVDDPELLAWLDALRQRLEPA